MGTTKTTFYNNKIGGFSANTQYVIFTKGYEGAGPDSVRSNLDTIYTRPDTATYMFSGVTATTISLNPHQGPLNPAGTKMSFHDSSASREYSKRLYLALGGDTSSVERFYNASAWVITTPLAIGGFVRGNWGIFGVRAQNDDSTYKTTWHYDSLQVPVTFDSAQFTGIDTNKIKVVFDCDTFATGWTLKPFIYSGTDTTWGDSVLFNTGVNKDTITINYLNKKYYGKVRLMDSSNVKYYSALDSARTYAWRIISATVKWTTDTSVVFTITKHGTMPVNSGYFGRDSARVTADCTRTYFHSDCTGFVANKAYGSIASFGDTVKFKRVQLVPGGTIKFRIFAENVDSLGNH
uniref:Uncharacterized protein n=1 Tax=viral metagenome TaxID=1070528 RepID=A0A6M3IMT6_9ZZZZ